MTLLPVLWVYLGTGLVQAVERVREQEPDSSEDLLQFGWRTWARGGKRRLRWAAPRPGSPAPASKPRPALSLLALASGRAAPVAGVGSRKHGRVAGAGGRGAWLAAAVRRAARRGLRHGPGPGPRAGGGGPRGARLALLRRPGALRTGKCWRRGPRKRGRAAPLLGPFPFTSQRVPW